MEFNPDNSGSFQAKIGATKSHMLTSSSLSNLVQIKNFEWALPDVETKTHSLKSVNADRHACGARPDVACIVK